MVGKLLSRRAALAAMTGAVVVSLPGCGAGGLLVRVPWTKVLTAVIRFLKGSGKWVLVLTGLTTAGETEAKEIALDSDEIKFVTVKLKDGSKVTVTPTMKSK